MKIGELSAKCNVPQSAIRYYIKSGLLIPGGAHPQYNFTDREYNDLQRILKMRDEGFSLKEIQDVFTLLRHSGPAEPQIIRDCKKILSDKKIELTDQMLQLKKSITDIDKEIEHLDARLQAPSKVTGVPLAALHLLTCPICGRILNIQQAEIEDGYVVSGKLCCGSDDHEYSADIENGIVKTGNRYTAPYDHPDLERGMYRDMTPEFSKYLVNCYDFISEKLSAEKLSGKVILEANINGYFFLYHHLELLPEDCIIVVIDKYPEMLEMYKRLIELTNLQRNILYIADASTNYPLMKQCVDVHISYFGESEHQLYHANCFIQDADVYFKKDALVLGSLLAYSPNSRSRLNLRKKYPESGEQCYRADYLRNIYEKYGYKIEMTEVGASLDCREKRYAFDCQVVGDPLHIYYFLAKRKQ